MKVGLICILMGSIVLLLGPFVYELNPAIGSFLKSAQLTSTIYVLIIVTVIRLLILIRKYLKSESSRDLDNN